MFFHIVMHVCVCVYVDIFRRLFFFLSGNMHKRDSALSFNIYLFILISFPCILMEKRSEPKVLILMCLLFFISSIIFCFMKIDAVICHIDLNSSDEDHTLTTTKGQCFSP